MTGRFECFSYVTSHLGFVLWRDALKNAKMCNGEMSVSECHPVHRLNFKKWSFDAGKYSVTYSAFSRVETLIKLRLEESRMLSTTTLSEMLYVMVKIKPTVFDVRHFVIGDSHQCSKTGTAGFDFFSMW